MLCYRIWKCCGGYQWDDTQKQCIPCEVGYSGVNCLFTCPSPSYGRDCQQECNCSKELCNHVVGCVESGESLTILYTIFLSDQSTASKTTVQVHSIHSAMRSLEDSNGTTMLIAIMTLGVCFMTLVALYLKFSICNGVDISRALPQQNESLRNENVQIYENV
ncbi:uncharacterized protein LOC134245700 [Saccostrea cucullata]|uniref:uncharacterized protein LOC134245700 n=1 Tax=Saccostrea cuccullata TaxID=36930 RepID=UPI002ED623C3